MQRLQCQAHEVYASSAVGVPVYWGEARFVEKCLKCFLTQLQFTHQFRLFQNTFIGFTALCGPGAVSLTGTINEELDKRHLEAHLN